TDTVAHPQINPARRSRPTAASNQQVPAGMGELLPPRRVQEGVLPGRLPRLASDRDLDTPQTRTHFLARSPTPILRYRLAIRPQRGGIPRRSPRRGHPIPLPRNPDTHPLDHPPGQLPDDTTSATRGEPDAVKVARPVRREATGNGPGATPA